MIKILFAASKYDYANPELGLSNEYYFFYDTFLHLKNVKVELFDWVLLSKKFGRDKMNDLLYQKVKKEKYDLVFFSIFEEEFKKEVIKSLSIDLKTQTFNIFANDDWQFDTYSRFWAPQFSFIATDVEEVIKRYKAIGYKNVVRVHWGINPRFWKNFNLAKTIDVSFVGQAYGNRKGIINGIKRSGVSIQAFGRGFDGGKLSTERMITIFNRSKVNLNISEHSRKLKYAKFLPAVFQPTTIDTKAFQMKARVFEVPGSGGFLLTTYGEPLKDYFRLGKEIETYKDFDELIQKVKFYLENDSLREKIARAGYIRTSENYTYEQRVIKMFGEIGLKIN